MQTPLRTLGVFNSSYSSFSCLNLGCTSYSNPINISTVGIIRSAAWIMTSLSEKHRVEFDRLQDDILFSSFKGNDLGKRILYLARKEIRTQCNCRISMMMPSQIQIEDIREWEQRQNAFVSLISLESTNTSEFLDINSAAGVVINSECSIHPGRLFSGEIAEVEQRDEIISECEVQHQGTSDESLTPEFNFSLDMDDDITRDDSLQLEQIFLCLKDSKNPGSGLHFYGNAGNMMQLPALQSEHIIISEISQELFLELAKSPLISDINNSILFRLQSLKNISNFEVGARENADYYIEEHSSLTGVIVGVGGDLQRADSIEIVMDQQSSSNLSED